MKKQKRQLGGWKGEGEGTARRRQRGKQEVEGMEKLDIYPGILTNLSLVKSELHDAFISGFMKHIRF